MDSMVNPLETLRIPVKMQGNMAMVFQQKPLFCLGFQPKNILKIVLEILLVGCPFSEI